MSQRELSDKAGLTQSHISQIERGSIEPGLSSLVDLARSLDLEVVLVPKKLMPAITNIILSASGAHAPTSTYQSRHVERFERLVAKQKERYGTSAELDSITDDLRPLRYLPLSDAEFISLQAAAAKLAVLPADLPSRSYFGEIARAIKQLRNQAVHRDRDQSISRPAYALDEDDDDA